MSESSNDLSAQTIEQEIEGFNYQITPLPFGRGRKALMRLIKVVSPVLSSAFKEGVDSDKLRMISNALDALPKSLDDNDLTYFAKEFGDTSRFADGGKWVPLLPAKQETHFAGRYLAFLRWLTACIKLNYGNFFDGVMSGSAGSELLAPLAGVTTTTESK